MSYAHYVRTAHATLISRQLYFATASHATLNHIRQTLPIVNTVANSHITYCHQGIQHITNNVTSIVILKLFALRCRYIIAMLTRRAMFTPPPI